MVMYSVYVLKSLKNGKSYTGSSDNVERRLTEHNSGESKSTRANSPYKLVYKEEFVTRSDAVKREKFFKTGKGRELLKQILGG